MFSILQSCFREHKDEKQNGVRWMAVENIGDGFNEVNNAWTIRQQWIKSFDIQKCYDSIQFVVIVVAY